MARAKPDGGGYVSGDRLQTRPRLLNYSTAALALSMKGPTLHGTGSLSGHSIASIECPLSGGKAWKFGRILFVLTHGRV